MDGIPVSELDDLFGSVANELRISILRELWDRYGEPVSFTELQSRVGVRDSGQFNYHLNVLVPEFVRKTEEGYVLTHTGKQTIGAAVSGYFSTEDVEVDSVRAGECMFCGEELTARYEGGNVVIDCSACENLITKMPVPPVTVASTPRENLPQVLGKHVLTLAHQLSRGFCTLCHGRVDSTLTVRSDEESVAYRAALDVKFECRACGDRTHLNAGAVVVDHPAVASFLFDSGIDPRETYPWELLPLLDPETTITSEDPLELELTVRTDGGALKLTLDDAANVVAYARR
ncbi:ArsR family transcriptional regulator [Halopelagius longus]|uniref:ArsR family transcriptional regulator n=1 Tax=Halopelagius longus TaxID=1236180 RepID=A0A370IUG3_9EURY|nr:ArsR family transcriptional regulator [Halopelagius longus]